MKKYKILMVLMGLEIGGAETHVVELSKELKKQGYDIIVASNGGVYEKELAEAGIRQTTVTALMEDGMFECHTDPCAVLFASLLWDWEQDTDALIRYAEHCTELN